jgi:hypothetical protein
MNISCQAAGPNAGWLVPMVSFETLIPHPVKQAVEMTELMCDPLIWYVMVRDAEAGCFDLRVEKGNSRSLRDDRQKLRIERMEES